MTSLYEVGLPFMEPPPRPPATADPQSTTSPQTSQSSQSEQDQDTPRISSATDQQQSRQASIYERSSPADPSIGELTAPQSTLTSLHDITSFAMSRHQSGSRHQIDHNPSVQLLSPESSQNPRRMSQVSPSPAPGFIFVNFLCLRALLLHAISSPKYPTFPLSTFPWLSYRQTHLLL